MKLRYLVFVFRYETLVGERTKAPPKYIDGALSYELCLSLRKSGQFSTYLTIVLTASSLPLPVFRNLRVLPHPYHLQGPYQ